MPTAVSIPPPEDITASGMQGGPLYPVELAPLPPELSARHVLTRPQAVSGALLLTGILTALIAAPMTALTVGVCCISAFGVLTALHQAIVAGAGSRRTGDTRRAPALIESELPTYTILLPLYQEAQAVVGLVRSLSALDYPPDRLDIKLLVRHDDHDTLEALNRIRPAPHFQLTLLPDEQPRTKPMACNHGLRHAQGELVVVFDAEDRPEPDQLRKAAAALSAAPPEVACVQARLDFWNPRTNLTTRHATGEYSLNWELLRPGLERLRAPVPLGGTSNHFPVAVLRELGAWDEFNVTEDIDLGIRLARRGYHTMMLDSITYEEANSRIGNWIRQRSRWTKGWLLTWLVHTRHPRQLIRDLGPRGALHFHLTVFGAVPPMLGVTGITFPLLWLLRRAHVVHGTLPIWLMAVGLPALLLSLLTNAALTRIALRRRGYRGWASFSLISLGFEILRSAAAARAVWQLCTRPHHWDKTVHGLVDESTSPTLARLSAAPTAGSGVARRDATSPIAVRTALASDPGS